MNKLSNMPPRTELHQSSGLQLLPSAESLLRSAVASVQFREPHSGFGLLITPAARLTARGSGISLLLALSLAENHSSMWMKRSSADDVVKQLQHYSTAGIGGQRQ